MRIGVTLATKTWLKSPVTLFLKQNSNVHGLRLSNRVYLWPKRQRHLKGCAVTFIELRRFDSCFDDADRKCNLTDLSVKSFKRQIEPQIPNEKKL